MDMSAEPEKGNEAPVNFHETKVPSEWQLNENNPVMQSSACSSASMVDSFCTPMWDQPVNRQNLGYCEMNVERNINTSSNLGPVSAGLGWKPNEISRGSMFLSPGTGILPHFPADSGFIERAARFSCFGGGNFSDAMNPFGGPTAFNPYSQGSASMTGPHEMFVGNSHLLPGMQMNRAESSKDLSVPVEHGMESSPLKNDKKTQDEAKQRVGMSGNESDEPEISGRGSQEEMDGIDGKSSNKGVGYKKRKRTGQATELNENNGSQSSADTLKDNSEMQQKGDQHQNSMTKRGGKQGKQGSEGLDQPKGEYIHVRARRGQATNSHSLAERIRREKISERMKYLQDLVPGCSKVTGKAVMLDEIINYVQSLQRQVEFLSMKLATVNPRLDFNIEGLLAKNMLQSRAGPSSSTSLAFPPDMAVPYPLLHPSQHGLAQAGLPGQGSSSDALWRSIHSQLTAVSGGIKDHTSQAPSTWDDELHNVVQMCFPSAPLTSQDLSGSLPPRDAKAEH